MNEKQIRIEKIIDANLNPEAAAEQTRQPWCSVWNGPFIVTGTDSLEEARQFCREFLSMMPDGFSR